MQREFLLGLCVARHRNNCWAPVLVDGWRPDVDTKDLKQQKAQTKMGEVGESSKSPVEEVRERQPKWLQSSWCVKTGGGWWGQRLVWGPVSDLWLSPTFGVEGQRRQAFSHPPSPLRPVPKAGAGSAAVELPYNPLCAPELLWPHETLGRERGREIPAKWTVQMACGS